MPYDLQKTTRSITLHVRRRPQLTTLIQVEIRAVRDANFAAYTPAHTLTEAGPRGVTDMARGVGREGVSAEEGAGMRLFAKQLLYEAKRGLPEFSLVPGAGVGEQEEEMTERHEVEYRKLVERQRVEGREEKSKAEVRSIDRLMHIFAVCTRENRSWSNTCMIHNLLLLLQIALQILSPKILTRRREGTRTRQNCCSKLCKRDTQGRGSR